MNPIHFQGLTCYHDCIISIVNYYGLNYATAFATLWSETDFRYDPFHEVYLTKRMLINLEALGAKVETTACSSPKDVEMNLSLLNNDEFIIVAMDAFYIPWNQFYREFHGPHYFIAQNSETEMFLCIDPTYNKKNEKIMRWDIIEHAYEISHISREVNNLLQIETMNEAHEILCTHPNMRLKLLSQIYNSANERKNIILLAKYVDAMIRNRYLYRCFLENHPLSSDENHLFLRSNFFLEWTTVKNGMYKAAVSRNCESIVTEVCKHFSQLIDDEIAMAEKSSR